MGILTQFQTKVNKKMTKKITFFGHPERSRTGLSKSTFFARLVDLRRYF